MKRYVMKAQFYFLAMLAVCLTASSAKAQPSSESISPAVEMQFTMAQPASDVKMAMRKLWEDHVNYTRDYIINTLDDLSGSDAVVQRLLKNQDDIGNAIKPYYGVASGDKLAALLRDHILIATEVVKAAKADDKDQLAKAQEKWLANGMDIAAFLSSANPNWPKKDLEGMLQKHLDLTTGEVVGRLQKDWELDKRSYDEGRDHMMMFADMLTDGIVKQFPGKFRV